MNIISLGAGVQSSTMALMAKHGEITPMPDCAIFADTQAEPSNVYEWLNYLEGQLPFPIYRVTAGNLEEKTLEVRVGKSGKKYTKHNIPTFTIGPKIYTKEKLTKIVDADGVELFDIPTSLEGLKEIEVDFTREKSRGMTQRQCTMDFKIVPIKRKIRELIGSKGTATQWLGISYDEIERMKPSRVKYITNIWPLIDKRMTRKNCLDWMASHGYPTPPRSACYFCPFHSDNEWRLLSDDYKNKAINYEIKLQNAVKQVVQIKSTPYLHRSCEPISNFFNRPKELDLFDDQFKNECEGHCGV